MIKWTRYILSIIHLYCFVLFLLSSFPEPEEMSFFIPTLQLLFQILSTVSTLFTSKPSFNQDGDYISRQKLADLESIEKLQPIQSRKNDRRTIERKQFEFFNTVHLLFHPKYSYSIYRKGTAAFELKEKDKITKCRLQRAIREQWIKPKFFYTSNKWRRFLHGWKYAVFSILCPVVMLRQVTRVLIKS